MRQTLKEQLKGLAPTIEIEATFTPVYSYRLAKLHGDSGPTTFDKMFRKPRRNDPLGLPTDAAQCIHVETVWNQADHTNDHVRCAERAEVGFLCKDHDKKVLGRPCVRKSRDYDAEAVGAIVVRERIALRTIEREVAQLNCRGLAIQFVKDKTLKTILDDLEFIEEYAEDNSEAEASTSTTSS